jgi:antirestriction protein ArdC
MNNEKKDIFQRVTDQIVKTIEDGAGSYRMPWRTSGGFPRSPINAVSRKSYRGVNVLILWATAEARGYKSGMWATYKQWIELGAQVRKGEKSANVVFWRFFDSFAENESGREPGETSLRRIPMARDYWVFNSEQVDNFTEVAPPATSRAERIDRADRFFRDLGVNVQPGENQALYRRDTDTVHMPAFEAFKEALFYYSVLCHETTHNAASRIMPRPTGNAHVLWAF